MHLPLQLPTKNVLELVNNHPDIFDIYIAQADTLGVTHRDIQVAWGFIGYFFGPKYPDAKSWSSMDHDDDEKFL